MSIELVARILNTSTGLPAGVKVTLVGLANHANPDGSRCFPSRALLARYGECDPRSITRHLARLILEGWIEEAAPAGQHRPTEYRIRLDKLSTLESRVDNGDTQGGHLRPVRVDTTTSTEPSIEPSGTVSLSSMFEVFWGIYPRKVGKGAARKAFQKAFKGGADVEQILRGARVYAADSKRQQADISFTAHPATWLNAERWLDEVDDGPDTRPHELIWKEMLGEDAG